MKAFFAKLRLLIAEARGKVTTYVALAIAGISQLAEHSEDLLKQWPTVAGYLPKAHTIDTASHWALSVLGVLAAITRVRRAVWPPKAAS